MRMKKQISWFKICAISLMITLLPGVLGARSLDTEDLKKIQCAQDKMRILAGFFNVDSKEDEKTYTLTDLCGVSAKKPVTMPDWFAEELPRMDSHKILYVKAEDYTYSEVDLWRQAFSNVYLYLDRAAQSLDPNKPIVLEQLSRGYVGNRLNLMATLDRLNKDLLRSNKFYTMKDSMQGRARSMLSTLELINNEFFSTIESFSSPVSQRWP